jgi:hypothetical protein
MHASHDEVKPSEHFHQLAYLFRSDVESFAETFDGRPVTLGDFPKLSGAPNPAYGSETRGL